MNEFVTFGRGRRMAAAALAVVVGFGLTACQARGGGYLPAGDAEGVAIINFQDKASFGFNVRCEMRNGEPIVLGELEFIDHGSSTYAETVPPVTYFGEVAIHGEAVLISVDPAATTCEEIVKLTALPPFLLFEGTYRPQDPEDSDPVLAALEQGEFVVLVQDQDEGSSPMTQPDGDLFSISLFGGKYDGYSRGGVIEGGNVRVSE